jgi:NAD-dependent deacetylase
MAEEGEIESSAEEFEHAARILVESPHVIALTGAGLSVESGIPPFRGPGGLWTKHGEPPMDGFQRFMRDPAGEWRKRLNPEGPMKELADTLAAAAPNPGHYALVELEEIGVLQALITQNIDNLHRAAGHKNILEIHGNATLLRCLSCSRRLPRDEVTIDPENLPPHCEACGGVLKGDTVQFGEPIPQDVLAACMEESRQSKCCIVAGTTATVFPAAQIPIDILHRGGRLVEVNLYESEITQACEVSLRGPGAGTLTRLVETVRRVSRAASH